MQYNVNELRNKLSEHVLGLGIDKSFLENPVFDKVISEIDWSIIRMNIYPQEKSVMVKEGNGNISFNWTSSSGEKYSMNILSSSPETFRWVITKEEVPFIGTNKQSIRVKNVTENIATIDELGFVTLTTNHSSVDNMDCKLKECNNITSSERKNYTPNGVMTEREYKSFHGKLTESFDSANISSMLDIPRQAFRSGFGSYKYDSRTLLVRGKLDTARMVSENKINGIRYNSVVPLNQEHGLMDMSVDETALSINPNVVIPPLSQEEIEAMLQRESNPKVAEGLRKYAIDRKFYSYDSAEDEHFVCEGISQSQGLK